MFHFVQINTVLYTFKAILVTRNGSVTVQVLNRVGRLSLKINLRLSFVYENFILRPVLKYMFHQSSVHFSDESKIEVCFIQNNIFFYKTLKCNFMIMKE
jgi:hypothetical protein